MAKTEARTKKKSELQELSEFIRDHMVTKEYLHEQLSPIHTILESHTKQLADIRAELKDIRRELHELREQVERTKGLTKEIDHILARVIAIEKHLGIELDAPKRRA